MLLQINFNYLYVLYGFFIFLVFIGTRYVLLIIRKRTLRELNNLLHNKNEYLLYQELLNNKRLRFIFRKSSINIMRLNGYLLEGNKEKIEELIIFLDNSTLEPYEKLDYYQKRFSYYVENNNKHESKHSLDSIKHLLRKSKSNEAFKILKEAELIYEIYINHNTKLIPDLLKKLDNQENKLIKGITEYRIAKLYYFEKKYELVKKYLTNAKENVKGSYWFPVVTEALRNHSILSYK